MRNPGAYTAAGKRVACDHCGGEEMRLMRRAWHTGFLLGRDRYMDILACTVCGRQHAFTKDAVERI